VRGEDRWPCGPTLLFSLLLLAACGSVHLHDTLAEAHGSYTANPGIHGWYCRSTRTRPGAPWLTTTLVPIAWPACRKKHRYVQAPFLRLKSRRGPKTAIVAVAASMLTAMYYLRRDGVEFRDLGDQHFAQRDKTRVTNRLLQRLRDLGVEVEVKAA
jgi:hypothetical protein